MCEVITAQPKLKEYGCDRFSVSTSLLAETFEYLPEDLQRRLVADANAVPTNLCWGAHDCESELNHQAVTDEEMRHEIISESLRRVEKMEFEIATPFAETLSEVARETL